MQQPLVSIITATYNGEKYLAEAIESVIKQDYPHKEYIIINDNSSDRTWEILSHYAQIYPRITVITNPKNLERSQSRNLWAELAQWEFLAFLDDDDIWISPSKISKQVAFLQAHPDHNLLWTDITLINEEGALLDKFIRIREENATLKANFLKSNQFILSTVLVKKTDFIAVGGFDKDKYLGEDYHLRLKIGTLWKIANLGEKLVYYRDRGQNTSNKNKYKLQWESWKIAAQFRKSYPSPFPSLFLRLISIIIPKKRYARKHQWKTIFSKKKLSK